VDGNQKANNCLADRHVLITGGTGSLGTALARRLLSGQHGTPAAITLFSRDELKQFHLRATLEREYGGGACSLHFRLGDVRDLPTMQRAMRPVDVVFHAAALKQVPQCEYNPVEAVQTNVMGLVNLVHVASMRGSPIEAVIAASTDKACHPINVMGMTKALQERILIAACLDAPRTRFMCARYGNVLASRGSVIETFHAQIREGGPVTVTRRDMTRFLVTLDDAVDALIALFRFGRGGEIFVPRAAGARIETLAECLIDGLAIPVIETGLRPGEKIHEVLINEDEVARTTERHGYYVLAPMLQELARRAPATLSGPFCSNHRLLDRAALDVLLRRHRLIAPDTAGPEYRQPAVADAPDLSTSADPARDRKSAGHATLPPFARRRSKPRV
jgi:UDP-glucose 4-epimerase